MTEGDIKWDIKYLNFKTIQLIFNVYVLLAFLFRANLDHQVFQVPKVSLEEMGPLEQILIQAPWVYLENR